MPKFPGLDHDAPETIVVEETRIACVGEGGALGHPKVWYTIGEEGFTECKYCDRRFVLKDGPADPGATQVVPGGLASTGVAPDPDGERARGEPRDIDGQSPR